MSLKTLGIGVVIGATVSSSFKSSISTPYNSINQLKENINKNRTKKANLKL